jgi:hypothetical protein
VLCVKDQQEFFIGPFTEKKSNPSDRIQQNYVLHLPAPGVERPVHLFSSISIIYKISSETGLWVDTIASQCGPILHRSYELPARCARSSPAGGVLR